MFLDKTKQTFHFVSIGSFEPWDFTNPIRQGIGGSEVSHIEMASRLAQRGHTVYSYAPVPWQDSHKMYRGVKWMHQDRMLDEEVLEQDGIWVIYRRPDYLKYFANKHNGQKVWLVAQDAYYETWEEEHGDIADKIMCLCIDHANFTLHRHPFLRDKMDISSNGICLDLIRHVEQNFKIERDLNRLIWPSSPDRGMDGCVEVFKRAKFFLPELQLHVFYGFDNIDKILPRASDEYRKQVQDLKDLVMNQEHNDIYWHGRIGQIELLKEWFRTGIWCYPTNFVETSCINIMDAQACGTITLTNPRWALTENLIHGVHIDGDPYKDPLVKARFVGELVRVRKGMEYWEKIRPQMMVDARLRFNWERFVDQWEHWALNVPTDFYQNQFAFQQRFAYGDILNVGADADSSGFAKHRKAINADVRTNNPITGCEHPINVVFDIRKPPHSVIVDYAAKFDTVILGDVIEHMTHEDGVDALKNCKLFVKTGGIIIVTCPHDTRDLAQQVADTRDPNMPSNIKYHDGVDVHHRYLSPAEFHDMLQAAGLDIVHEHELDMGHFLSTGVVAQCQ